ncbi:MAG: PspC domain-containing protein [Chloroflexi bacterium]|nr:PspC domain-containing protein [Chloroflexota bacterium]
MRVQRLTRSLTDRVLGGVCGGIGAYVGVDPWWVRVMFLALGLFTAGTGVLIYLALWLILPLQTLADLDDQAGGYRTVINPETMILLGAGVIAMGLVILARNLGVLSSVHGDAFLPLVVILFGLTLLFKQLRRAV